MKIYSIAYHDHYGDLETHSFIDPEAVDEYLDRLIYNFLNREDYDAEHDEDEETEEEDNLIYEEMTRLFEFGYTSVDRDDKGNEYLELAYNEEEF